MIISIRLQENQRLIEEIKRNKKIDKIMHAYSIMKRKQGVKTKFKDGNRFEYLDCICAFDIETSRLKDIDNSFMYIWQFNINGDILITGRTWQQYKDLLDYLNTCMHDISDNLRLVVLVHNLSYEFQFLKGIFHYQNDEVFAMDNRKVLRVVHDNIEYRCTYIHSNLSLDKYYKKFNIPVKKLDGKKFNYNKVRYPWSKLNDYEYQYCINDVLGLPLVYRKEMQMENDDLYSIPLTSTGYVRRDARNAMKSVSRTWLMKQLPSLDVLLLLQKAFRGGDTHANRYYANAVLDDIISYDFSSDYPACIVTEKYPTGEWKKWINTSIEEYIKQVYTRKTAVVIRCTFTHVKLHDELEGKPYLAYAKCKNVVNETIDNGRILNADSLETCITEIDFKIIHDMYDYESMEIHEMYVCNKDYLPLEFRKLVLKYYSDKTWLKPVDGEVLNDDDAYMYGKSKEKINALYGMMVTDIIKSPFIFDGIGFEVDESISKEDLMKKAYRNAFMSYAWGVYVTAYARERLYKACKDVGVKNFIYADTDSVKCFNDNIDLSPLNDELKKKAIENKAYAKDKKGNIHYMGVMEHDGTYLQFKTLGAKKYVYTVREKQKNRRYKTCLHVTTSGVNKKKAPKELKKIDNYEIGFKFVKSGGTESVYNDIPFGESRLYKVGKRTLEITSNVCIKDSTYTLGVSRDYQEILNDVKFWKQGIKIFDN